MAQSGTTINLDWMTAFAQKNGVKIALSEYGAGEPSSQGIGTGTGLDDGTWTAASTAWMNAQPAGFFLWTDWSDDEPADDIVTPGAKSRGASGVGRSMERDALRGSCGRGRRLLSLLVRPG
jgi:hypothetical protein